MSYRIQDFTSDGLPYPFSVTPAKTAATLRRMADDLERKGGTTVRGVTVVEKAVVDGWAATTVILRLHVPRGAVVTAPSEQWTCDACGGTHCERNSDGAWVHLCGGRAEDGGRR